MYKQAVNSNAFVSLRTRKCVCMRTGYWFDSPASPANFSLPFLCSWLNSSHVSITETYMADRALWLVLTFGRLMAVLLDKRSPNGFCKGGEVDSNPEGRREGKRCGLLVKNLRELDWVRHKNIQSLMSLIIYVSP